MAAGSYSSSHDDNSFGVFLEGWLHRQEQFVDELLVARDTFNEETRQESDLFSRVLAHYEEYYEEKSRITQRNIFQLFSPTWFTPLEKSFLWITGFKPGLAFTLVAHSLHDLTEYQNQRINRLKYETKVEERSLTEQLAKIQESVAAPPLMELARQAALQVLYTDNVDAEITRMDENMETLRSALKNVVIDADRLRTRTAESIIELLNPLQSLKFLIAAAQFQLRLRVLGKQREAERLHSDFTNGW